MRRGAVVSGLVVAGVVLSLAGTARAEQIACEVLSIRASSSGSVVGTALTPYRAQLMSPPLNAFTSFALTGPPQTLRLDPGAARPLALGHGISGELRFVSAPRSERHRLRLVLQRGGQTLLNTQVAISAGHPFFVAGPIIPGGTLVVGIICR